MDVAYMAYPVGEVSDTFTEAELYQIVADAKDKLDQIPADQMLLDGENATMVEQIVAVFWKTPKGDLALFPCIDTEKRRSVLITPCGRQSITDGNWRNVNAKTVYPKRSGQLLFLNPPTS